MATVMAKCSKCKELFEMDEELYRHRKAHGSKINCPACLEKSHINKYKKIGAATKRVWDSYNPEERKQRAKNAQDGIHNMSDEKKALRSLHSSIATREYMASLSDEERQRRSEMTSKQMTERNAKMTHEQYIHYIQSVALTVNERGPGDNVKPSSNEQVFIDDYLNKYGIQARWQYYNTTEHPEFYERFPNNPITGGKHVSPFHKWDFYIKGPEGYLFLDIDGSTHFHEHGKDVHSQSNIEYSRYEYAKFNDSQRPYQRDGLPAYVIQVPDDDLSDDCKVINLETNAVTTVGEFIKYLNRPDVATANSILSEKK